MRSLSINTLSSIVFFECHWATGFSVKLFFISCLVVATAAIVLATSSNLYAATIGALLSGNDLRIEYASGAVVVVSFNADGVPVTARIAPR